MEHIYTHILQGYFRVTSMALGQSYDCPSASEVTLKNEGNRLVPNANKIQPNTNRMHKTFNELYAHVSSAALF